MSEESAPAEETRPEVGKDEAPPHTQTELELEKKLKVLMEQLEKLKVENEKLYRAGLSTDVQADAPKEISPAEALDQRMIEFINNGYKWSR